MDSTPPGATVNRKPSERNGNTAKSLRLLIVEDSDDDTHLMVRALEDGGYDPAWEQVDNAKAMSAALDEHSWDLVLSDAKMPRFSAAAALEVLQRAEADLPFIVVSGHIGEEQAVALMKTGAHDYVDKGNLSRLLPVVRRELQEAAVRKERNRLEARLRQAEKMEYVGQLAGGIAHDFNNLLTVVTGYAGLILTRLGADDPVRADVELIRQAGKKAAHLTRQLLAFGRRQILRPRVLDLNQVVSDFEGFLRRTIPENVEILTDFDPELGSVRADPGQIEQVLLNLAINARDAMPTGGKLTIETSNVELDGTYGAPEDSRSVVTPGPYVMMAVTDTGKGMDEGVMSQLFEPFFTTKEKREGTGLGLATTYGIVRQSGGHIWAYSEPGKGATFKVYLPRIEEAIAAPGPDDSTVASTGGSEWLLVVEDNEMVRGLAVRALEDYGYRVLSAEHPEEALKVCADHEGRIDLLVTDVVMPGHSGVELAARIEEMRPDIKTLYISGYAYTGLLRAGQTEADIEFLSKPFSAAALARKVREVLDKGDG